MLSLLRINQLGICKGLEKSTTIGDIEKLLRNCLLKWLWDKHF